MQNKNLTRRQFFEIFGYTALVGTAFYLGSNRIVDLLSKPKQNRFLAGVDFDGYNVNREATVKLPNGGYKVIETGYYSIYTVLEFAKRVHANLIGIVPYYPEKLFRNSDQDQIDYNEYRFELLKEGDGVVRGILNHSDVRGKKYVLFRIKDFPDYQKLPKEFDGYDFLGHLAENIARISSIASAKNSIIELEANITDESSNRVNKIIERVKKIYPKIVTAISLIDHKDRFGDLWYRKVLDDYSKNADVVILNSYLSDTKQLKENILHIKGKNKKVIPRVITGEFRRNYGFSGDEKDLEAMVNTAYENADGCIVGDISGVWLYVGEKNLLDGGRRRDSLKRLYFKYLGYSMEEPSNSTIPQVFNGVSGL